jgi:DNA polymerase-1
VKIALKSDAELFRRAILPSYKANRGKSNPPMLRRPLMNWLINTKSKSVVQRPGLEGDDILGILATVKSKDERIIWSIDKDLRQIPSQHLVMGEADTSPLAVEVVTEAEGNYLHMLQTLTGDATDNYKGLPGCGPVKAAKILDRRGSSSKQANCWWNEIVFAYEKAGLSEADALLQARIARILRASDYDFKRREPILWQPPNPEKSPRTSAAE